MQAQPNNSFDGKVIVAVVLFFVFYFGWQQYLAKKYPQPAPGTTQAAAPVDNSKSGLGTNSTTAPSVVETTQKAEVQSFNNKKEETFTNYDGDNVSFKMSSKGMGLKHFLVKRYTNQEKLPIQIGQSEAEGLFELRVGGQSQEVHFEITQPEPGKFKGVAIVGETKIEREMNFDPAKYSFESKVMITNPKEEVLRGIHFIMPEKIQKPQSSSILFPSYEHQDFFVIHGTTKDVINFNRATENVDKDFEMVKIVAMGSQYFAAVLQDHSDLIPQAKTHASINEGVAETTVSYKPTQNASQIQLSQLLYAGPKSIDILKSVDAEMTEVIDFGFFGFIARPMLYTMKWFFTMFQNWGLAIILLTIAVRFLALPLNILSFKSMKAMQKIQPLMTATREKYKDDPLRMNQEVMALMKTHKANPMGGCLPMLIQIPVFFALYRVIGSSVELYQSPFIFWIRDLSHHDTFYVLPILMGITMFIQQKMTPTAMDPTQAKILAFMPLIFTAFMLTLPSGLTLYMFVSALFGITQQYFLLKSNNANTATA